MFEVRADAAKHLRKVTIFSEVRGREVVGLVNYQQVPGKLGQGRAGFGLTAGGEELLQNVRLLQVVIRGDGARVSAPGVRVQTEPLLQVQRFRAVDHVEAQRELILHLLLPLKAKGCWADDEDFANTAPDQQ